MVMNFKSFDMIPWCLLNILKKMCCSLATN